MMLSRTGRDRDLPLRRGQTVEGQQAPWGCAAGAPYRGLPLCAIVPVILCAAVCFNFTRNSTTICRQPTTTDLFNPLPMEFCVHHFLDAPANQPFSPYTTTTPSPNSLQEYCCRVLPCGCYSSYIQISLQETVVGIV